MIDEAIGVSVKTATLLLFASTIIGGLVEWRQGFIGRPAIALNAILLWQVFYPEWMELPNFLQGYLNIGSVLGAIAILSYILRFPLRTPVYTFALWTYGSTSILVLLVAWVNGWI